MGPLISDTSRQCGSENDVLLCHCPGGPPPDSCFWMPSEKKKSNISGTYVSLSDCCRLAAITEKMNPISKSIEIRTQIGNFQQSKLKVNISPSKVLGWFSVSPGLPPAGITYIYKIYVDDTHVSGVHPNATCNQMRYKEKLSLPL